MSFEKSRRYSRPVLHPISLPPQSSDSSHHDARVQIGPQSHGDSWVVTTHTFLGTTNRVNPACWPSYRFHDDPAGIPDNDALHTCYQSESARSRGPEHEYHMFDENYQDDDQEVPPPRFAVKRYAPPKTREGGLTLFVMPGMHVPTETFEPMIESILAETHCSGLNIAEIWSVSMPSSGQTAMVNLPSYLYGNCKDIARDLLLFLTLYLPLHPGQSLPSQLPARKLQPSNIQPARRNLHVLAHSMGAQSALLIAAHAPDLFASLTLFDPAIIPPGDIGTAFFKIPKDRLAFGFPFHHQDTASLRASLDVNRRTKGWDPRVKQLYAEHGLSPDGKLVAHPRLEWALYYDQETALQCFDRLGDIKAPMNFVVPKRPLAVPLGMLGEIVKGLRGKAKVTVLEGVTHSLCHEKVEECAGVVVGWLMNSRRMREARL